MLEAGKSKIKAQSSQCRWGASSWFADVTFLFVPSSGRGQKEKASSVVSLHVRALIPLWELRPHDPMCSQRPLLNYITLGVRVSTHEFWGEHKHSVCSQWTTQKPSEDSWHTSGIISPDFPFAYFATLSLSFPNTWVPHIGSYRLPRSFALARELCFTHSTLTVLILLGSKWRLYKQEEELCSLKPTGSIMWWAPALFTLPQALTWHGRWMGRIIASLPEEEKDLPLGENDMAPMEAKPQQLMSMTSVTLSERTWCQQSHEMDICVFLKSFACGSLVSRYVSSISATKPF